MSDLIRRQDAIDAVFELSDKLANEMLFIDAIVDEIENLPSAESERTAKVRDIVHTHGYPDEGLCGNCNEDVNGLYDYCPYCGARLEWE